jgi:molybdopterin-guanine dinucleotide biosynthesis protein A
MGGREKAMLSLGRQPMITHVVERLAGQVERVILNANGDPARFRGLGLPVIADTIEGLPGPLAGLLAGMDYSLKAMGGANIVTVAADTPFFPPDLVARLVAARREADAPIALAASESGTHHTIGLFSIALMGDLAATLKAGDRKAGAWAARHRPAIARFDAIVAGGRHIDPFFNINRPEDLARAEEYAEALA